MKYAKMLALAVVAAGALMAFLEVGTASATVLCSTTADPCPEGQKWPTGTVLDLSLAAGGSALSANTKGEELDKCSTSTIKGKISSAGSSTETVILPVEELTWEGCTFPTKTITKGNLEFHRTTGTSNGTVRAGGTFEWTYNSVLFGSCIYGFTSGTSIGDIKEGNPAVLHVNVVIERFSGSAFACPETDTLTATYALTSPAGTTLSVSST